MSTNEPADREALGRLAWDAWWAMYHRPGEVGDWSMLTAEGREQWCCAAEAASSAVRAGGEGEIAALRRQVADASAPYERVEATLRWIREEPGAIEPGDTLAEAAVRLIGTARRERDEERRRREEAERELDAAEAARKRLYNSFCDEQNRRDAVTLRAHKAEAERDTARSALARLREGIEAEAAHYEADTCGYDSASFAEGLRALLGKEGT